MGVRVAFRPSHFLPEFLLVPHCTKSKARLTVNRLIFITRFILQKFKRFYFLFNAGKTKKLYKIWCKNKAKDTTDFLQKT